MALAQAGSNQLSLETPQNGAGESRESLPYVRLVATCRLFCCPDRHLRRIRPFHYGQGRQLGSSRFYVAHDL